MARHEFSDATKRKAYERANGVCECGCGQALLDPEYDHYPVPAALGGSNGLDNCRVLRKRCHRILTDSKDKPAIAKTKRIADKRMGLRKTKRGFQTPPEGYDPWTRSMKR